ncbi:MAG: hypothetical protein WD670_08105 [Actinomycetota bacterium]
MGDALHGIDAYALHPRQVDDDPVVADRLARDVVTSAADGNRQIVGQAELERGITSATPVQRAISGGLLSIIPLWTLRAVS